MWPLLRPPTWTTEKDDFEILRWPYVSFNDLCGHTLFYKKNCVFIMNITEFLFLNQFKNECARNKKKAQIPEFQSLTVFFLRYRRTYVLSKDLSIFNSSFPFRLCELGLWFLWETHILFSQLHCFNKFIFFNKYFQYFFYG